MPHLNEDDLYRTSTQYRLWNFSPEALASLRAATHDAAIERAKSYLGHPKKGSGQSGASKGAQKDEHDIEKQCLTLQEETRLVQRYCDQIRQTCDHFKWPVNVRATAVQYLKRFYLTNSCLTYPPKEIYKSVLFLASKTEAIHMTLGEFARRIKTAPEQILAPEYKIIQALRFTLDVRQPFRGLKGALMELLNIAEGQSTTDLRKEMSKLAAPPPSALTSWKPSQSLSDRAQAAYTAARHLLDAPALLTDAYLLYTPPQIYLAALRLSDPPLLDFYLAPKLPPSAPNSAKILATITSCAAMLASHNVKDVLSKDERAELDDRLEACRDPDTRDMVGLNAKAKRGDGDEDGEKAKRRKLEREASAKEGEDLFGPSLTKPVGRAEVDA